MAKDDVTIKRLKTAPKKKSAKKKSTDNEFLTVKSTEYGYSIPYTERLWYSPGTKPESAMTLEEKVEFWKDKYQQSLNQASKLTSQVTLLQSIIDKALTRSCSGSC